MPWMTCEKVYQSEMCCEFSELWTTPCHSLIEPHVHQGTRPISSSMAAAEMTMASARTAARSQARRKGLPAGASRNAKPDEGRREARRIAELTTFLDCGFV